MAEPAPRRPPFRGFRSTGGTVYVEYEGGEVEFSDLEADPSQLENLAKGTAATGFPAYRARVEAPRGCRGASCWAAEDDPLGGGG